MLVTGASQGLGREIALAFANEGATVAIIGRRADKLAEVVDEMGGAARGHLSYAADLMEPGVPAKAVRELTEATAAFEIVVHNVGGTLGVKDPLSPSDEWQRVWRFNVGIAIDINALVIPPMQAKKWGRVIHISSVSGVDIRGSGPYAASKAYLNAYTKSLGRSIASTGVVVSALMPGALMADGTHWDKVTKTNPGMVSDFLRHHQAIGRFGRPDEIAAFTLFMASEQVTFSTAAVIPIDGGNM